MLTSMNEKKRYSAINFAFLMYKMNFQILKPFALDFGGELRYFIQFLLGLSPVESVFPVCCQLLHVSERGAIVPSSFVKLARERGKPKTLLEITDSLI